MLTKETCIKIRQMIADQTVAEEIITRLSLLEQTPKTFAEARCILESLDLSDHMSNKIHQTFRSKMANYDHGECGDEIANGLIASYRALQSAMDGKVCEDLSYHKLDKISFEALVLALSGIGAAQNFKKSYSQMIDAAMSVKLEHSTEQFIELEPPRAVAKTEEEIPSIVFKRKRIVFRKAE